ncbi:histidine phosphatase family protein [Mesomycoplasma moatsii]|uniref:histidine phosphatase family protein n=1 Tax=Mesomycoplasma moatsii TaxID=171287 RepID=UPI0003B76E44
MTIYFIRHCKTKQNSLNRWSGKADDLPSDEGLRQLENLKNSISFSPDIIFSSPLKRAILTAEAIKNKNTKLIVEDTIKERDFGLLEGTEVIAKDKKILADIEINTDLGLNVEKINDMYQNRIKPFLNRLKSNYKDSNKKIVIVSHSWVGRLIAYFASKETKPSVIQVTPHNATIYKYII